MRKSIAVLALAGAFGTLFADNGPEVANWFTAIGDSPSFEQLNPVNGAWTITPGTDGSADYVNARLVLELGEGGSAVFAATDGTAPDTNTITRVTITTTFEPLTELPDSSDGDANLVVYAGKFYVWDGDSWVDADIAAPASGDETPVLAEIKYQGENVARAIRFTIGEGTDAVTTGWIPLVSTENAFANVTIKGAATLDNIIGQIEMGRAENNGIKYSTIADALNAASEGSDKTVVLLRDAETEEITMISGVKLDTNGKKSGTISPDPKDPDAKIEVAYGEVPGESTKSGEVKLYVKTSEENFDKIKISVNDNSKEVFDLQQGGYGQIKFHLRTSTDVLNKVKPDGSKALKTDPDDQDDNYRQFLSSVALEPYEEAHADPARIQAAIVKNAPNGIPHWQNYVMGVTDNAKPLQPVAAPAGDKDEHFITLSVPVINKANESGDYKVTYKVANDDGSVTETVDDPQAIKVPLGTGNYEIQAVLSEPDPAPAEPTVGE